MTSRLLLRDSKQDDDSPYLSMADFFSLLSLVLIFLAITIPSRAPLPRDAVPVLVGRTSVDNQDVAADPRFAYLYLRTSANQLEVDFVSGNRSTVRAHSIGLNEQQISSSERIILGWLNEFGPPARVIYVLPRDDGDPRGQQQAIRLLRAIREVHPTSVVIISDDDM